MKIILTTSTGKFSNLDMNQELEQVLPTLCPPTIGIFSIILTKFHAFFESTLAILLPHHNHQEYP